MTSTLMWLPVRPEGANSLSFKTKVRISRKLFDTDGSTGTGKVQMDFNDIGFLEGMIAAGDPEIRKDCEALIEAIKVYGAIELWHQH